MMKSFVAFLFALLAFTAVNAVKETDLNSSSSDEPSEELLEKRAVFGSQEEPVFGSAEQQEQGEPKGYDRERKKLYYQQSALERRFEDGQEKKARSQRRLKKGSKNNNYYYYQPYYWVPPVGAAPVRPVSSPVAAPVTVNYQVPVTAPNSPRLSAPIAIALNSNSKGYGYSSKGGLTYYNQNFVSSAPVAGPTGTGTVYVQATATDCQSISNGGLVEGQRFMGDSTFTFGFNLVLNNGQTNLATVIATAKAALQALVAQRIVNCNGYRRQLHQIKHNTNRKKKHRHTVRRKLNTLPANIVGNANFDVTNCAASTTACEVAGTCFTCDSTVSVATKGPADEAALQAEIASALNNSDVIGESQLGEIATSFTTTTEVTHQQTTQPQIGGDPHIVTWKGEHYEYHGQCDMVMVHDSKFASGKGLDIHIRTKLVRFWSYIKNVSIRIGSDILEIVGNPDVKSREPMYWINFEYLGELDTIGGFPITYEATSGSKSTYEIDLSSEYGYSAKIIIKIYKEFVRVKMLGGESVWGETVGLLGDYHSGETIGRDGVSVFEDYYKFGAEWQVNPTDPKLFQSLEKPQYPESCLLPDNPSGDRRRRLGEGAILEEQAEKACASLKDPDQIKDCVYDILATQDLDMVGAF